MLSNAAGHRTFREWKQVSAQYLMNFLGWRRYMGYVFWRRLGGSQFGPDANHFGAGEASFLHHITCLLLAARHYLNFWDRLVMTTRHGSFLV